MHQEKGNILYILRRTYWDVATMQQFSVKNNTNCQVDSYTRH